jgi:hypothetical protein
VIGMNPSTIADRKENGNDGDETVIGNRLSPLLAVAGEMIPAVPGGGRNSGLRGPKLRHGWDRGLSTFHPHDSQP